MSDEDGHYYEVCSDQDRRDSFPNYSDAVQEYKRRLAYGDTEVYIFEVQCKTLLYSGNPNE